MRYALGAFAAALAVTGCGEAGSPATTQNLPDLVGWNLDEAEETLDARGIAYSVETPDGDTPLIDHLWSVCSQTPSAGTYTTSVTLYAEHSCD